MDWAGLPTRPPLPQQRGGARRASCFLKTLATVGRTTARQAGARKVCIASAAPAVRYQNVYGIDMPARDELVASERTDEEVAEIIGADWLVYQAIEDLEASARKGNPEVGRFECSVFNGRYITGDIDEAYLTQISYDRSDSVKQQREMSFPPARQADREAKASDKSFTQDVDIVGLHNHG